jgi:hypothetical protein
LRNIFDVEIICGIKYPLLLFDFIQNLSKLTVSANLQNTKFMTIRAAVLELSCTQTDERTERCSYALRKDANAPMKNSCIGQSASSEAKNPLS